MKTKSPAFRASRLAWRFQKSGGDGQATKRFSSFGEQVQSQFIGLAGVGQGEVPAIGHVGAAGEWMVITSDRIVWSDRRGQYSLALKELADATVQGDALLAARGKDHLQEIVVVTKSKRYTIEVESGAPFIGVWNALKMAATWFE